MKKFYEFKLEQPLTAAGRKALDRVASRYAELYKNRMSFSWDGENDDRLHIETPPVRWEMVFQGKKATVYGAIPFMMGMLFTQEKRAKLEEGILGVLNEAGFMQKSPKAAKESKRVGGRKP
jgi:hypothetical protein